MRVLLNLLLEELKNILLILICVRWAVIHLRL